MAEEKKSPVKAISMMMIITLAGKVTGLIRDRLLTVNYGIGMEANAFLTASRIPRVFFDAVFASAITASFIPVFNEYMVKRGKDEAYKFSGNFISIVCLFSFLLTALGMVFAPALTHLFAGGFDQPTSELCSALTRIMFPTVMFTGLAYSFVGILQSMDEFNLPAAMSFVSNLIIIAYYYLFNDKFGIFGLSVTFLIAWLMQAVIQMPALKKRGFRYIPSLDIGSTGMKKVFALMLPVMVSTWVTPINQTVNARFGSALFGGGGVSAIELSYNLYSIIIGVFILSITNYIFPKLSQLNADKNNAQFQNFISSTMHVAMYAVIPMMAGLMSVSTQLVDFIYGGGEFDEFSVMITSRALLFLCLGMIGYAVQAVVSRAFFAEQNGTVPLVAGIISIVVNIVLCFILVRSLDVAGLAIASAASCTANAAILLFAMKKKNGMLFDSALLLDIGKITAASAVMAVAVRITILLLKGRVGKLLILCIPVVAGAVIYYVLTLIFNVWESKTVLSFVSKKLGRG